VPELPEVETVRRDLDRELSGRRIVRVVATGARSLRRHPDLAQFAAAVRGATVVSVSRRGKYLLLRLVGAAEGDRSLVVHLGMSGQLLLHAADAALRPHTHAVLGFDDGRELRFVDPRTFGEIFLAPPGGEALAHLGPDPLADLKSWNHLADLLAVRSTKLKALLMDQRFLAGIGNIYSDEILHRARLRWDRSAATLTPVEVRRLYRSMGEILGAAIELRGSSLDDQQYRDVFGAIGAYQGQHRVYGREAAPCLRCRCPIVRVRTAGRSTFLCPRCQA
jgi:formamidopyrimidine-DNA glycosylase